MNTNAERLTHYSTTGAARLTCAPGIHGNDARTSFFRFVRQQLPEQPKRRVMRRKRQVPIARHESQLKLFKCDQIVSAYQLPRRLMPEIAALVGYFLVQPRHLPARLAPALATLLATSHTALRHSQLAQALAQPVWVFDRTAVRQRQQVQQAHINADLLSGRRLWFRGGHLHHQTDIPLAEAAFENHMLDSRPFRHRPVQLDLHLPHTLHVQAVASQLAAVAVAVFDRLESAVGFEARIAGRLPFLYAAEEGGKRLIQTAQHLLRAGSVEEADCVGKRFSRLLEPHPLVIVRNALATTFPRPPPFVKRVVIHRSHLPQQEVERFRLLATGV